MILTLFSNPFLFFLSAFALIIAITVHEFAHAKTADYLGDPTPQLQGRVTLNPLAHLDLYGTLFLLLAGFGWGKPVQFDPFNLEHEKRDTTLISIAGPISNFVVALLCSVVLYLYTLFGTQIPFVIGSILVVMIQMNLLLAVFNLIPVHPLDGFKIVGGLLNEKQSKEWYSLQRFGFIFLIMLILPFNGTPLLHTVMDPILSFLNGVFIP